MFYKYFDNFIITLKQLGHIMAYHSKYSFANKKSSSTFPIQQYQYGIKAILDKKLIELDLNKQHTPTTLPIVFSDKFPDGRPNEYMLLGTIVESEVKIQVKTEVKSELNTSSSINIQTEKKMDSKEEIKFDAKVKEKVNIKDEKMKTYNYFDTKPNEKYVTQTNKVFVNINDPWCLIAVGIQGSGKSHTLMRLIESCSLKTANESLRTPMTSLICHFDPDLNNYCEAVTLAFYQSADIHIIVPPDVYLERKRFYSSLVPEAKIHPLLFNFQHLTVEHIRKLMTVEAGDNILYMNVLKNTLRKYQKGGIQLTRLEDLENDLIKKDTLQKQQVVPLRQRIALLRSLLSCELENASIKLDAQRTGAYLEDISQLFNVKGAVIILDLSNPLMDQNEVCGVFNIFVDMFVHHQSSHGKVLCFDEAHKFLSKSNELAQSIILSARELRHLGLRLLVSTQNPDVLPDELMELSGLAVIHQTFSPRWIKFLKARFPLDEELIKRLEGLGVGQAVIYSPRAAINSACVGSESSLIQVSNRKFSSSGSKLNKS